MSIHDRAREEAEGRYPEPQDDTLTYPHGAVRGFMRAAFSRGAEWAHSQRPTREQIARALFLADRGDTLRPGFAERQWDEGHVGDVADKYYQRADVVLALEGPTDV